MRMLQRGVKGRVDGRRGQRECYVAAAVVLTLEVWPRRLLRGTAAMLHVYTYGL